MGRVRDGLAPVLRLVGSKGPSEPRPLLDDAEILAGVRAGDAGTAAALHDRARPIVIQTLVRMLGRGDREVEDVAQRALIDLAKSLARFRGECSLDTWIARVTAHTAYKILRRRKLERRIFSDEELLDVHESAVDVEREATHRDGLERIRDHLAAMSPDAAWTLVLHDVCGHDLREVAEITGASAAAAQSRLVRARRDLHARLAADPELVDLLSPARHR